MDVYGPAGPWGVMLDVNAELGVPRWYEHHKGGPKPFTKDHARALADTLNRGGMSGLCVARPIVVRPMHSTTPDRR